MLTELDSVPAGFLETSPTQLHTLLNGPTLIHLPGRVAQPLFISVLLHGNEDTGLKAVQAVLRRYQDRFLPRAVSLFVGNVAAASQGVRRLEHQLDYNRAWPGTDHASNPETLMMARIIATMRAKTPFASVDIHNNSGRNPHYACVNQLEPRFFYLATLFSRTVVYFLRPKGVQSAAFAALCPAVTVECGKPGEHGSIEHAVRFVDACLHLRAFPEHPFPEQDIDLYHTVAVVKIPEQVRFSFHNTDADLCLDERLEEYNFRPLSAGTPFGRITTHNGPVLDVQDEADNPVLEHYFTVRGGEILLRRPVMPAMLTTDTRAIRQDCLCYLMERLYP